MRIVSRFKDYYDGLQDPTDKELTYVRVQKQLDHDDPVTLALVSQRVHLPRYWMWKHDRRLGQDQADGISREWSGHITPKYVAPERTYSRSEYDYEQYECVLILFCGKLYRGIMYREKWTGGSQMSEYVEKVYWTRESFDQDHKWKPNAEASDLLRKEGNASMSLLFTGPQEIPKLMDAHFMTRCPVIGLRFVNSYDDRKNYGKLVGVLNCSLKRLQFIRVMDPTIMFQELSMFLGGVLSNNDKPEPVDNKYKIMAHGFDLKESFRKGPTKEHR